MILSSDNFAKSKSNSEDYALIFMYLNFLSSKSLKNQSNFRINLKIESLHFIFKTIYSALSKTFTTFLKFLYKANDVILLPGLNTIILRIVFLISEGRLSLWILCFTVSISSSDSFIWLISFESKQEAT